MYPKRYRDNRRAALRRFPYLIWYRVEDESVIVLALVHASRDPRLTRERLARGDAEGPSP